MVKPTERRVGYGVALGYGITDLFGGGAFAIIGTWLLFFYTTYCGLSVVEAGSIFAIARVIDALLSPIMGYVTDNFGDTWLGRKFGRRRFFLLLSSPPDVSLCPAVADGHGLLVLPWHLSVHRAAVGDGAGAVGNAGGRDDQPLRGA
ncbi:putative oligogalacturonide transporter [Enterobacter cancerogenus]|uniref:Putative oligogalacturonide transporter n=1 Tax=Enterobacter cancerogenus TaxID=69218 RepID=A0A484XTS8_9ENTR|nr:putative oligogalacturonide transporter [Enterobacter cancerogenus]